MNIIIMQFINGFMSLINNSAAQKYITFKYRFVILKKCK